MEIKIRQYGAADFAACRALWVELTEHHRAIYGDPGIGGDDPGQYLTSYLATAGLQGPWVAEVEGKLVGLTGLIGHGEEADIEPLVVAASYRGCGVGTALLARAVQEATALGVRFLNVRPVARNVEALRFFVEAGFDLVGHVELFRDLAPEAGRKWKEGMDIHGAKLRY